MERVTFLRTSRAMALRAYKKNAWRSHAVSGHEIENDKQMMKLVLISMTAIFFTSRLAELPFLANSR